MELRKVVYENFIFLLMTTTSLFESGTPTTRFPKLRFLRILQLIPLLSTLALTGLRAGDLPASYTNRYGIKMILIRKGAFAMGNDLATDPALLKQTPLFTHGGTNEQPVHPVKITYDFYISETEITAAQFNRFHEDHEDTSLFSPFASGMSWEDAAGYCRWLSEVEGKHYRLPTEAEWEYVARAGSKGHFSSGDRPLESGVANAWGVKNMHTDAVEWVHDWYAYYPSGLQVDPVGPATGMTRVVRGGGLNMPFHGGSEKYPNDGRLPFFRRSANRASLPPAYAGRHNVGFRIVEALLPSSEPHSPAPRLFQQFVRQKNPFLKMGPDPGKPWFRQRDLLPIPVELASNEEVRIAGLHPSMHGHNHDPGLAVAPNGDLVVAHFSSTMTNEDLTDVSIIATRLRYGAREWDLPSPFFDIAGSKDNAPVFTTEGDRLLFAAGGSGLDGVVFKWQWSDDNGATWSPIHLPLLYGRRGPYYPQPISNFYRGADGTLYLPSDGVNETSFLWASKDNGHTWFDTGGRTGGRHTVFAFLDDGVIFGLGGKASDIDGYMPKSISRDGGKTWVVSKTPFPAVGPSRQKPSLVRLASGRLFAAGDFLNNDLQQPSGMPAKTSWVALSEDNGETWHMKVLPGVKPSFQFETPHIAHDSTLDPSRYVGYPGDFEKGTLGYSMAAQAPNGVIHLVSSKNYPSQHWEMNEAWILSSETDFTKIEVDDKMASTGLHTTETYGDGSLKALWGGLRDSSGRFLLDGSEVHFYPSGQKKYEVTWDAGRKTGTESYWDSGGNLIWQWIHRPDRSKTWTQYWPNGKKRLVSNWQDNRCHGPAKIWDQEGNLVEAHVFQNGIISSK